MSVISAIVLLAVAVYAQTVSFPFHFDDYAIFADRFVTSSQGWWRVFRLEQTRPLTYFTFWVNHTLGGGQPWGYHAVNVAIHAGAALATWAVFRRILTVRAAWIGAAVFALHPLQSEAVAYVFARATLLAALLCLLAWRDWLAGNAWRAAAWFLLAVLAKEECVAFPVFLLGVEWIQGRWRRELWPALATMIATAGAAGVRLLYVAGRTKGAGLGSAVEGITAWQYLLTQPKVIWNYLLLVVCPLGQNFDHDVRLFAGWDAVAVAAIVGLACVVGIAIWKMQQGVWLLGALVLLAPSSSVVPVADLMFEHRMYLSMISLAAGAGILLERIPRAALVALFVALAGTTWARTGVWSTEETLWSDAAAKSPAKVRPKLQLARAVAREDPQRAQALLVEARRLDPRNPETFTQMGALLLEQNPYRALLEFDEALRLQPGSADAHSNRGTALYLLGREKEAEAEFRRALARDPCHPNARHNLGLSSTWLPPCPSK